MYVRVLRWGVVVFFVCACTCARHVVTDRTLSHHKRAYSQKGVANNDAKLLTSIECFVPLVRRLRLSLIEHPVKCKQSPAHTVGLLSRPMRKSVNRTISRWCVGVHFKYASADLIN